VKYPFLQYSTAVSQMPVTRDRLFGWTLPLEAQSC
jgi:hypothetical protein